MPTRLRLRQLELLSTSDRFDLSVPVGERRLTGTLSVSTPQATHLVVVADVSELLVALLSDLPYGAHGQHVQVSRAGHHLVEVRLLVEGRVALRSTLPREQFTSDVREMVTMVASELARCGASALARPMLAVLDLLDEQ